MTDRGDPRKYVLPDPERMPKAGNPAPPPGSDRMTPERLHALRMLAREPIRPDDPARLRDVQASLQDALDEIGRLHADRNEIAIMCSLSGVDHPGRALPDRVQDMSLESLHWALRAERAERERDALINLCVINVNDHFARGDEDRWDGYLDHFEVDPRADPWASFDPECEVFWQPHGSRKAAVAALRRTTGIWEDVL